MTNSPAPTDAELAAWTELAERATPGKWTAVHADYEAGIWGPERIVFGIYTANDEFDSTRWDVGTRADREFVCASRDALPRLIAAYSQSQVEAERLRSRIDEIAKSYAGNYPNIETVDPIEKLWAIEGTLEGRALAIDDLHAEIRRLKGTP